MELDISYLSWIILALFMVITVLEYRYIMQRNSYINSKIRKILEEEDKVEELFERLEKKEERVEEVRDLKLSSESINI
jgi:recombinational DNA repair protein (RecF pathway)